MKFFNGFYERYFDDSISLQHRLFNLTCLVVIVGAFASMIISIIMGYNFTALFFFVLAILFGVWGINYASNEVKVQRVSVLFSLLSVAVLFPIMFFLSGGLYGGMLSWLLLSLLLPWVLVKGKASYILFAIGVLADIVTILLAEEFPLWVQHYDSRTTAIVDILQSLITVALIVGYIFHYHKVTYERKRVSLEQKEEELKQTLKLLENANERMAFQAMQALVRIIDVKDKYTNGHSARVANYSVMIANELGKSEEEVQLINNMAILHDVGKIVVPDEIINKPGKLTDEEYEKVKSHSVIGGEILKELSDLKGLDIGAKWHHERYDGGGYPDGLKGEEIPEVARIIAVADAYDAMTSKRSYRDILPQSVARAELIRGKGTQFDPLIADKMVEIIDKDKDFLFHE